MPQLLQTHEDFLTKYRINSVDESFLKFKSNRQHSIYQFMGAKFTGSTSTIDVNESTVIINMMDINNTEQSRVRSATSPGQLAERKLPRTRQSAGYTCDRLDEIELNCRSICDLSVLLLTTTLKQSNQMSRKESEM